MLQGLITRMNHHHQQPAIVMDESLSNLTSAFGESASASTSSINPSVGELSVYPPPPLHQQEQEHLQNYYSQQDHPPPNLEPPPSKKKRSLPGNPDPDAEVIALSPKSLLATNRFMCEICNKGFQRDQNLQLHRRGHNLPWKLKQRSKEEVVRKKVYVCPETSCVHHDPSRALGDLTGIKKHFCRKHGEKKWKCDKCSKRYAVQSDWKAHSKICGTREYRCDCGTLFSRRDSFITHRAFCDALAEETARSITANPLVILPTSQQNSQLQAPQNHSSAGAGSVSQQHLFNLQNPQLINAHDLHPPPFSIKQEQHHETRPDQTFNLMIPPWLHQPPSSSSSSTMMFSQELLQTLRGHDKNPSHAPSGPSSCSFPIGGGPSPSQSSFPSPHPHMSATALLQKAAQFGATMSGKITDQQQPQGPPPPHAPAIPSPILSPRDHQDQLSTSSIGFFNQAPGGIAVNGGNGGGNFPSSSPSSLLLHDIMMNSLSSFDGGGGSGNDDQTTRDFLGLRPLSHSEILSFAGLGNVAGGGDESSAAANASSSSTSQHDQDRHNRSWQG